MRNISQESVVLFGDFLSWFESVFICPHKLQISQLSNPNLWDGSCYSLGYLVHILCENCNSSGCYISELISNGSRRFANVRCAKFTAKVCTLSVKQQEDRLNCQSSCVTLLVAIQFPYTICTYF